MKSRDIWRLYEIDENDFTTKNVIELNRFARVVFYRTARDKDNAGNLVLEFDGVQLGYGKVTGSRELYERVAGEVKKEIAREMNDFCSRLARIAESEILNK